MMPPSLAQRLVLIATLTTGGATALAALGAWSTARWQRDQSTDRMLGDLARHLPPGPTPFGREPPPGIHPPPPPLEDPDLLLVWVDGQGAVRQTSRSVDLRSGVVEVLARAPRQPPTTLAARGRSLRVLVVPQPDGHLVVARDITASDGDLRRLALVLTGTWAAATGLVLVATLALRRALTRPVDDLARDLATLDAAIPEARLSTPVPPELVPVVTRLNDLLERLAAVRRREGQVHAEIAHELRTPVAALRTALEFAGDDPLARGCLPTVVAMQGLVANLLILARLEAGGLEPDRHSVDLAQAVQEAWALLAPQAEAHRQHLDAQVAGVLFTSPDHLRMILGNLLGNAVAHAPSGSRIELTADPTALVISNPLDHPLADPEAVFQPFWRGDAARSGDGLHAGLGLALCRRLVTLLGGTITVTTPPGRFVIRVAWA